MIATFLIEISLMIYTLWRYKMTTVTRLAAALLVLLATFQLAEFNVCQGLWGALQWSNIGFVAITLLPPIGIHAMYRIAQKRQPIVVAAAYVSAALFALLFAFSSNSLNGHQCLGNYVIFQVNASMTVWYGIYYWGWVVFAMIQSALLARTMRLQKQRRALWGFAIGYACFLVPTTAANIINNSTVRGIPSIMCGFAVLFALILGLYVLPHIGKPRVRR
jgi:hypothetical protein